MAGKSLKRTRTAAMQNYEAVPITDPVEIAELEAKLKRFQDAAAPVPTPSSASVSRATTTAELLELAEGLSTQSRIELIIEIAARLSAEEQSDLVKRLVAQLPTDARKVRR